MKNIFFYLSALPLIAISCGGGLDDRPYDPDAKLTTTLVQKKVETFDDASTRTTDYHYDGYKLSNQTDSDGGAVIYFYSGNSIVKVETYQDNALIQNDYFNYNAQGQITSHKRELPQSDYASREDYTYDGAGNASYTAFFGTIALQNQADLPGKLFFTDGELVKKETYLGSGTASSETFTYDLMNAPLRNVTGLAPVLIYMGEIRGAKHNLLTTSGTANPRALEYQYNGDNFALVSTSISALDGGITTVFTYQ